MLVSCDSCEARYDYPDRKLNGRGAKFRCSRCKATVVVFPKDGVAMAADHEPTTEDWTSNALPPRSVPPPPPRTMLDSNPAMARGPQPPADNIARSEPFGFEPYPDELYHSERAELDSTLSVTPPPPRALRQPEEPTAAFLTDPLPPFETEETVRFGPPPRPGPTGGSQAPVARFTHGGSPVRDATPPHARPVAYTPPIDTGAPADLRYASYGGQITASGAPNRAATGPTHGQAPQRATYGSRYPQQTGNTDQPYAYGAPTPPPFPHWGAYPYPNWTGSHDPRWTGSGMPRHTGPATYGGSPYGYTTAGATMMRAVNPNAPTVPPAPMVAYEPTAGADGQAWAWMPIQQRLERRTPISLLATVLAVGFLGACLGVMSGQLFNIMSENAARQAQVPPPSRVMIDVPPSQTAAQPFRVEGNDKQP